MGWNHETTRGSHPKKAGTPFVRDDGQAVGGCRGRWRDAHVNMSVALVMMDNRPPDLGRWLRQHGGSNELTLDSQAQLVTMLTAYLVRPLPLNAAVGLISA
jgi:hypothetical protein